MVFERWLEPGWLARHHQFLGLDVLLHCGFRQLISILNRGSSTSLDLRKSHRFADRRHSHGLHRAIILCMRNLHNATALRSTRETRLVRKQVEDDKSKVQNERYQVEHEARLLAQTDDVAEKQLVCVHEYRIRHERKYRE